MEFKDISGILAKVAPMIATSLGGPLAGAAVSALGSALGIGEGGSKGGSEKAIVEAISGASPEVLLALKRAEQDYALRMAELGFDNTEAIAALVMADKDSARKREIQMKDATPKVIAYSVTAGFFATLGIILFVPLPEGSRDIINVMLGVLGSSFVGVREYYLGSSNEKTQMLAEELKALKALTDRLK